MPAYNSVGLFHSRFVHLIISMQNRDIFFFFSPPSFPVRGRRIVIRRGVTRSYSSPLLSSPPPSPLGIARGGKLNNISSNIYAGPACFNFKPGRIDRCGICPGCIESADFEIIQRWGHVGRGKGGGGGGEGGGGRGTRCKAATKCMQIIHGDLIAVAKIGSLLPPYSGIRQQFLINSSSRLRARNIREAFDSTFDNNKFYSTQTSTFRRTYYTHTSPLYSNPF